MKTTTEKPVVLECPPNGFYWITWDGGKKLWSSIWEIVVIQDGYIWWIGTNEVDKWGTTPFVITDVREIKPPTEETT